jgi:hypothetical protein
MNPYLLLDIDGVLCPFGNNAMGAVPIPGHEYSRYSLAHTPWLKRLNESYDLVWASLWEHGGNQVISPLHDLPSLPVIEFKATDLHLNVGRTLKLSTVKRFIGNRPMAWVDDDLLEDAFHWAAERDKVTPTLLIKTECHIGLTEDHVDQLDQWSNQLK